MLYLYFGIKSENFQYPLSRWCISVSISPFSLAGPKGSMEMDRFEGCPARCVAAPRTCAPLPAKEPEFPARPFPPFRSYSPDGTPILFNGFFSFCLRKGVSLFC